MISAVAPATSDFFFDDEGHEEHTQRKEKRPLVVSESDGLVPVSISQVLSSQRDPYTNKPIIDACRSNHHVFHGSLVRIDVEAKDDTDMQTPMAKMVINDGTGDITVQLWHDKAQHMMTGIECVFLVA